MKKILITIMIIAVLLVTACVQIEKETTETVDVEPVQPAVKKTITSQPKTTPEPTKTVTVEVKALLDKHKGTTNYEYSYDLAEGSGFDRVYAIGDKIRTHIDRPKLGRFDFGSFISDVFIDRSTKIAIGACLNGANYCTDDQPAVKQNYASSNLETPKDLISSITYAEKIGDVLYDRKEATKLSFTTDNKDAAIWVDKYSGFPLRVEIYNSNGDIIEKHTYKDLSTDSVSESDVTLPSTLTIQE